LTANDLSAGGTVDLQFYGDFDWSLPRSSGTAYIDTYGNLPLTVGILPVQVSNFKLKVNAKWVAGGGGYNAPDTTQGSAYGIIYEQLGATPATGDPYAYGAAAGTARVANFSGNGYQIANTSSNGDPSTYILGANTNYYLQIDDRTFSDNTTWSNFFPSVTLTNEFGGNFGDGFSGFDVSFSWATVPEPSTIALLTLGGLGLLARRRANN